MVDWRIPPPQSRHSLSAQRRVFSVADGVLAAPAPESISHQSPKNTQITQKKKTQMPSKIVREHFNNSLINYLS